jgi:hypothetical protein
VLPGLLPNEDPPCRLEFAGEFLGVSPQGSVVCGVAGRHTSVQKSTRSLLRMVLLPGVTSGFRGPIRGRWRV